MKTKSVFRLSFIVFTLFIGLQACKKDAKEKLKSRPDASSMADGGDVEEVCIQLGEQLPNPYTVDNMNQAFANIHHLFPLMQCPVRLTNKYIKFTPDNEMETSILNQDESLITYTYPLDRDIVATGTFYLESAVMTAIDEMLTCENCEPSTPPEQPLWCVIEGTQYVPGGIDYVELADLYLPETDMALASYVGSNYTVDAFTEALVT
ncbi:MAG: hypothetical protein K8F30_01075, partial [Taibaiella sp.]|nr:hypothetical protein [Taibaiella sp.]